MKVFLTDLLSKGEGGCFTDNQTFTKCNDCCYDECPNNVARTNKVQENGNN